MDKIAQHCISSVLPSNARNGKQHKSLTPCGSASTNCRVLLIRFCRSSPRCDHLSSPCMNESAERMNCFNVGQVSSIFRDLGSRKNALKGLGGHARTSGVSKTSAYHLRLSDKWRQLSARQIQTSHCRKMGVTTVG